MRAFLLRGRDVYSEDLKGGRELERQKECALGGGKAAPWRDGAERQQLASGSIKFAFYTSFPLVKCKR